MKSITQKDIDELRVAGNKLKWLNRATVAVCVLAFGYFCMHVGAYIARVSQ